MRQILISATMFALALLLSLNVSAVAAADPVPLCPPVAMAGGIMIYFCEDLDLYVNQLGFMAFEP